MFIYKTLWEWREPHRVFKVELPITQCRERLAGALEKDQQLNPFAITGVITDKQDKLEFYLAKKSSSFRDSALYPGLYGYFRPLNNSTEVSLVNRYYTSITVTLLVVMALPLLDLVRRIIFLQAPWWSLIVFALFFEVLVAFAYLTQWPHSNDAKDLESFLVDLLST